LKLRTAFQVISQLQQFIIINMNMFNSINLSKTVNAI